MCHNDTSQTQENAKTQSAKNYLRARWKLLWWLFAVEPNNSTKAPAFWWAFLKHYEQWIEILYVSTYDFLHFKI